ncbi:MAG: DUF4406 domain-containing protein [Sphingobacteriia bacterium]|nr:MAG: DUF4406 domain-containing protein [Sphingobacteriia bacterium]
MKVYLIGSAGLFFSKPENLKEIVDLYVKAEHELTQKGYDVFNIMNMSLPRYRKEMLFYRIKQLLKADEVYILPSWEQDTMAQIELVTAVNAGIKFTCAKGVHIPNRILFFI